MSGERKILDPYDPAECMTPLQAAVRAGVAVNSIRYWCEKHGIGRKVVGKLKISGPALEMLLADDFAALTIYHAGERNTETIQRYFALYKSQSVQNLQSAQILQMKSA